MRIIQLKEINRVILSYIFTVAGLAMLAVFLKIRVSKGASAFAAIIKSAASIGFILVAFNAFFNGANRSAILVCVGLVFGLLGDIWLDQKFAHPESGRVYTYAGFCVFAAGHIFYDAFLIRNFYAPGHPLYLIIPFAAAVVIAVLNYFGEDLLKLKYGEYKIITVVYTALLFSFVAVSLSMAIMCGFRSRCVNKMLAASVLFTVSDFILSGTYFGKGRSRPVDIITNHVTYYLAQYLIALSLVSF